MTDISYEIKPVDAETAVIDIPDDMNTDEVHDDVELMLNCTGPEIMELIASDPKHYLDVVSRYTKTRDGRDIYLSDLFNIIITRNADEYRIKFKLQDNGNWYEVGYTGGVFTEDEVHRAFVKKVQYAIDRPVDSHRSAILDTLQPGTKKDVKVKVNVQVQDQDQEQVKAPSQQETGGIVMKSQGDQTKLSKIDRFMCRTVPSSEAKQPVSSYSAPVASVQSPAPVAPAAPAPVAPKITPKPSASASTTVLSELDILRTLCPEERVESYNRLVNLLRSDDMFYQSLVNLLPRLSSGQRVMVLDFLQN